MRKEEEEEKREEGKGDRLMKNDESEILIVFKENKGKL